MAQLININSTEFRRCNLSAIQSGGTWASIVPDANEIILISTTNSLTADGSGNCDAYIVGNRTTAAAALELHKFKAEELDEQINGVDDEVITVSVPATAGTIITNATRYDCHNCCWSKGLVCTSSY